MLCRRDLVAKLAEQSVRQCELASRDDDNNDELTDNCIELSIELSRGKTRQFDLSSTIAFPATKVRLADAAIHACER